ncbi:MAG TPA: lysophospholipid acyltransferase family protein [Caldilineaceae bacterium]|nr:lysophospholipid acyltransferase family protein [Caldilineaceae bacterium]
MEPITDLAGQYTTPPRTTAWLARAFPSLLFYTRFLRLVFWASGLARRGAYHDEEWHASSLAVLQALESVGVHIQITGLHHLRSVEGPCVLVANHMSTLETIVLPGIVQPIKDVTFIVKRGIVEYPVFKHIMLARDPIVVDRINPRADLTRVLEEGPRLLGRGRSIVVFPQTTRTLRFDPAQFNTIGVKLARTAGVPVVPVAVRSDAWGIGRLVKEFGKIDPSKPVRFAFGPALSISGRGAAEHQAIIEFIRTSLAQWE